MKVFTYLVSVLMIVFGLVKVLLLSSYLSGVAFIAIGIAFIAARRYRLRRDQDRITQRQGRTFE
jgi:membrane protein implicated in regulation of membrane protease activity